VYQNGVGSCIPLAPLHQRSNSTARAKLNSINSTIQGVTLTEYNASVTHITVIIMAHFALCPASRHAHCRQYYFDMTRINYAVNYNWRSSTSLSHGLNLLTLSCSNWSPIIANLLKYVFRNSTSYGQLALKISELPVSKKCLQLATGTLHAISQKRAMFSAVGVREQSAGEKSGTKNGEETRG